MSNTSDHELIRNAIARYSIGIDNRDWSLFTKAFTPDAQFHYNEPIGTLTGHSQISEKVKTIVGTLYTQHALTTQLIELTGDKTAKAITYCLASHYGSGETEGKSVLAYGSYTDILVKDTFDGAEEWRISERTIGFQAPLIGEKDLLNM